MNGARKYSWISRLNGSDDIRAVANTRLSITCRVVSKIEGAVIPYLDNLTLLIITLRDVSSYPLLADGNFIYIRKKHLSMLKISKFPQLIVT